MSSFRTSSRFGVIGVFVVMALCAAVGLTLGQNQANPRGALALIFGIIAVYLVFLFFFQTRDLSKAEAADDKASAVEPGEIENPATLEEPQLWASLAIRPIDAEAVRARKEIWGTTRQSIRLGMIICALIFLSVPPVYLLGTWVPLMIGAPLIVLIAGWKSVRLLAGGGDLDRAYDASDRAMAPLGLSSTQRPDVVIEPKGVAPFRMGAGVHGALVLQGKRHGRKVTVRMPADGGPASEVLVAVDSPTFEFKARDGRLKASDEAPQAVRDALKAVPNSTRWNGVRGECADGHISVQRKRSSAGSEWLLDLWLAERLAESAAR